MIYWLITTIIITTLLIKNFLKNGKYNKLTKQYSDLFDIYQILDANHDRLKVTESTIRNEKNELYRKNGKYKDKISELNVIIRQSREAVKMQESRRIEKDMFKNNNK